MFNEYYYLDHFGGPIYISIITLNNAEETSIYKGNRLILRKSLRKGNHLLQKDNISLNLEIKTFKVIPELRVDNQLVTPVKLKRKELKNKLAELNINNDINPKLQPKEPFKFKSIITPIIFILIGALPRILTQDKVRILLIPSMIIFFVASIYLFGGLVNRIPERHADDRTKGKLKFLIGIAGLILIEVIISNIENLLK